MYNVLFKILQAQYLFFSKAGRWLLWKNIPFVPAFRWTNGLELQWGPTSQPTTTSASAGTLKKHYILHLILTELLQQNINVKCAKYNVCFFVFTFPLDCCLASQLPRWAIRTSCGGNTANGT